MSGGFVPLLPILLQHHQKLLKRLSRATAQVTTAHHITDITNITNIMGMAIGKPMRTARGHRGKPAVAVASSIEVRQARTRTQSSLVLP